MGDFSVCGMVVLNILDRQRNQFRARALLDSGSGTNFVSDRLLPFLDFEKIGSRELVISGINTTQKVKYDLVKLFIFDDDCPVKTIRCYVIPGLLNYKVNKERYRRMIDECQPLQGFTDPLRQSVDHEGDLGIILGPGAINDISRDSPYYFKS